MGSRPERCNSVFAQRVAYVALIAFIIVAWLLAAYADVYIAQSLARVVHLSAPAWISFEHLRYPSGLRTIIRGGARPWGRCARLSGPGHIPPGSSRSPESSPLRRR